MSARPPSPVLPAAVEEERDKATTNNKRNSTPQQQSIGFPLIPRYAQQQVSAFGQRFKMALPFPRLYSGPLFASPSVAVSTTHVNSIGPLTPPLTDPPLPNSSSHTADTAHTTAHTTNTPSTTTITATAFPATPSSSSSPLPTPTPSLQHKKPVRPIHQLHHQGRRRWSSAKTAASFNVSDVVHDIYCCMFRITLDAEGTTAALCYLPTQFERTVEFYHTEIPTAYRELGIGDLLVTQGLRWAEATKRVVIPTCPFVQRYLDTKRERWHCIATTTLPGDLEKNDDVLPTTTG